MIQLQHVNKYYNRRKKNELHIIKDTTISFPEKGLVVLLGASGSGKTTLLNVIGGLDVIQEGNLLFEDQKIDSQDTKKWDAIRNQHIGYIFQNYYLFPTQTVYENISLSLKMIGIDNKNWIDERIAYMLQLVQLNKYQKRRVDQLSGGQQQRVAIARALAKNPKVIIADEPTGNLDSKQTFDIMKIIKQISLTKLVILVTHEEKLAEQFADRIIKIEDGKVVADRFMQSKMEEVKVDDHLIYLNELNHLMSIDDENKKVHIFADDPNQQVNVRLVVRNQTLYLDIDRQMFQNIHILNNRSEVKLIDGSRKKQENTNHFTTTEAINLEIESNVIRKNKKTIGYKDAFLRAVKRVFMVKKKAILMYIACALCAMIIAISSSVIGGIIFMTEEGVMNTPKNAVSVEKYQMPTYTYVEFWSNNPMVDYVHFNSEAKDFSLKTTSTYQFTDYVTTQAHFMSYNMISNSDVMIGSLNKSIYNVYISSGLVKSFLRLPQMKVLNITNPNQLLGMTVYLNHPDHMELFPFVIAGITSSNHQLVYSDPKVIPLLEKNTLPVELVEDQFTLVAGRMPSSYNEVIISEFAYTNPLHLFEQFQTNINGNSVKVVGIYRYHLATAEVKSYYPMAYLSHIIQTDYTKLNTSDRIIFQTNQVYALRESMLDMNISSENFFEYSLTQERVSRWVISLAIFIVSIIAIPITTLGILLLIRTSMIQQIYDIGVYRSLGVPKKDILRMFFVESALITVTISYFFYAITMLMIDASIKNTFVEKLFSTNVITIIFGALLIFIINISTGLSPVKKLMHLTPSQIITKYDI